MTPFYYLSIGLLLITFGVSVIGSYRCIVNVCSSCTTITTVDVVNLMLNTKVRYVGHTVRGC
jgi:hypothetical protein